MMRMGEYCRKVPSAAHSVPTEEGHVVIQAATEAVSTASQRPVGTPSPVSWPCCFRRKRVFLLILLIFIPIISGGPYIANAARRQLLKKAIIKPFKYAYSDAVSHLVRGKLSAVTSKLKAIVKRLKYPQYYTIGNAWFGALIFDLSEYILEGPQRVDFKEALSESKEKPISEAPWQSSAERPAELTSETSESTESANAQQGTEDGKPAALDVSISGQPLTHNVDAISGGVEANDVQAITPRLLTQTHSDFVPADVPELNPNTLSRWKTIFVDIFMQNAEQLLPVNILDVVEEAEDEQYSALRPTLEHVLYKTLSEFYPTLMTAEMSSILTNFYFAVSCDTCPFSMYTTHIFMELISSGRSGAEALFLSDKVIQSTFESWYISEECRIFNEEMKLLSLGNATLQEVVTRLAAATPPPILTMADLVLAGTENVRKERQEVAKTSEYQKAARSPKFEGPNYEELPSAIKALSIKSQSKPVGPEVMVRADYVNSVHALGSKRRSLNPGETVGSPEVLALHEGIDEVAMEKVIQSVKKELLSQ